ncbi:MAG: polyprenyl synthetase family protein, partial [archaeon]
MKTNIDVNEERMENAVKTLKDWKRDINQELSRDLEKAKKEAEEIHIEGKKVVDYLEDYTLRGGKRLRPGLIIAGYKAVGGKEHDKIVEAANSIEFLQSYLIIQDDVYDEDDLRRGEPTVHKMYEKYHKEELGDGNSEKFGRDLAIIVGDVSASLGVNKLLESKFDKKTKIETAKKLEKINRNTNYGQALDLKTNNTKLENTE